MTRFPLALLSTLFLSLCLALPARAHKVNIFAYAEAGTLFTESSFGGRKAVNQGIVEVRDTATDELLLSGTTDSEGKWSTPIPPALREKRPALTFVIKAGEGHQGQWRLQPEDYLDGTPAPAAATAATPAEAAQAAAPAQAADPAALESLVNRLVEAKVAPLRKQIGEAETRDPGAAEILGGLGFIMGLAALVLAARRRRG